jgi:hypothetical protein
VPSGSKMGYLEDAETGNGIHCHHQEDLHAVRLCHQDCAAFSIENVDEDAEDGDDDEQVARCWGDNIGMME